MSDKKVFAYKQFAKLVTHVAHFLKAIAEEFAVGESYIKQNLTVKYDLEELTAHIYPSPNPTYTNGNHEFTYDYTIIDKLVELSNKYGISYRIGKDVYEVLHFQIYV